MSAQSGSEYLQEALGDVLAKALTAVAKERPEDPIQYLAEYLYVAGRQARRERRSDDDSGNCEDSSANTLSSEERQQQQQQQHKRRGGQGGRSRRKRTAHSEPTKPTATTASYSSVTATATAEGSSSNESGLGSPPRQQMRRTQSLNDRLHDGRPYHKHDPRRLISFRVPVAALPWDEYRIKRGLRLPPMASTPSSEGNGSNGSGGSGMSELEAMRNLSLDGKRKHGQLQPMSNGELFDWRKHDRRNQRMLRENLMLMKMQ